MTTLRSCPYCKKSFSSDLKNCHHCGKLFPRLEKCSVCESVGLNKEMSGSHLRSLCFKCDQIIHTEQKCPTCKIQFSRERQNQWNSIYKAITDTCENCGQLIGLENCSVCGSKCIRQNSFHSCYPGPEPSPYYEHQYCHREKERIHALAYEVNQKKTKALDRELALKCFMIWATAVAIISLIVWSITSWSGIQYVVFIAILGLLLWVLFR